MDGQGWQEDGYGHEQDWATSGGFIGSLDVAKRRPTSRATRSSATSFIHKGAFDELRRPEEEEEDSEDEGKEETTEARRDEKSSGGGCKKEKMRRMPKKEKQRKVKQARKRTATTIDDATHDDDAFKTGETLLIDELREQGIEAIGSNRVSLVQAFQGMRRHDCPGRGRAYPLTMAAMPKQSHGAIAPMVTAGIEELSSGISSSEDNETLGDDHSENNEALGDDYSEDNETLGDDNSENNEALGDDYTVGIDSLGTINTKSCDPSLPGWSLPPSHHVDRHLRVPVDAGPSTGPGPCKGLNAFEVKYRSPIDNIACSDDIWKALPGGITVDSGAAESVMPVDVCRNYPLEEGPQKRMGVFYVAANGEELDNEGERRIAFATEHGGSRSMTFQVTQVNKVLGSVSHLCSLGQQVVFNPASHPDGSYIRDLTTETITPLRQENGVYKLDAWIKPYGNGNEGGFARQGL